MTEADLVIVGGGMVGLALAAALSDTALQVVVVEREAPGATIGDRVSALNLASLTFLERIGMPPLAAAFAQPIQAMEVWQADAVGRIDFTAADGGAEHLGVIAHNDAICQALRGRLGSHATTTLISGCAPQEVGFGKREAWLRLADGRTFSAPLLVAADGAHSWLRQQAALPQSFADYGHDAVIATLACELPHQGVAYQVFQDNAVVALLPLADPHRVSLVWSRPPTATDAWLAQDADTRDRLLTVASDRRLGLLRLVSPSQRFPLRWRYTRQWTHSHLAVIGDAAHTIHPLAGQGVNLGLMDAAVLAQQLRRLHGAGQPLDDYAALRHFERWRKADALALSAAMGALRAVFAVPQPLRSLVGLGVGFVDRFPALKQELMRQALWGPGQCPELARPLDPCAAA